MNRMRRREEGAKESYIFLLRSFIKTLFYAGNAAVRVNHGY